MMTYSLDLEVINQSDSNRPFPPVVRIVVKTGSATRKGDISITSECMSEKVVEQEVDRLIQELKKIKEKAKRYFD